jgi:hypothetical protein
MFLAKGRDCCLSFDPRPRAGLDATIVAEHERRPAVEQHHASFREREAAKLP